MNTSRKGIDDVLAAGIQPTRIEGEDIDKILDKASEVANNAKKTPDWEPILQEPSPAPLPELPTDTLPDWMRDYVEAEATFTQVPVMLPGLLTLATLAAITQKAFEVEVEPGYIEPLNLYVLVGMDPASRKSQVVRDVTKPVVRWQAEEMDRRRSQNAEARARRNVETQRLKHLEDEASKKTDGKDREDALKLVANQARLVDSLPEPHVPRILVDDITPEALTSLLAANGGSLAVLSAEADLFDVLGGRYTKGTPNIGVVLKAHSGDDIRVDRKGRPSEQVSAPALTIGLAVQPEVLSDLVSNRIYRERGLTARFLFARPASMVGHREGNSQPVPDSVQCAYDDNMAQLLKTSTENNQSIHAKTMKLDKEARALRVKIAEVVEARIAPDGDWASMAAWAGKLTGTIVRIAGILHLADHPATTLVNDEIPEATMRRALKVLNSLVPHAEAILAPTGTEAIWKGSTYLEKFIRRNRQKQYKRQDLWQATKGTFGDAAPFDLAIDELIQRNIIRESPLIPATGN